MPLIIIKTLAQSNEVYLEALEQMAHMYYRLISAIAIVVFS